MSLSGKPGNVKMKSEILKSTDLSFSTHWTFKLQDYKMYGSNSTGNANSIATKVSCMTNTNYKQWVYATKKSNFF